jgi:hypothetical protein
MRKLSRFGAAALALALSVTFLTPMQALAAKIENNATLHLNEELADNGVIDSDTIKIGDISGTGTDYDEAELDAERNVAKALLAKGLATTTKPMSYEGSTYLGDGTKVYYGHWNFKSTNSEHSGSTYTYTYKDVYAYKFTNTQTKKSSGFRNEVNNNFTNDEAKARSFQSALRVKKGEITYVAVPLTGGDTIIESIKSSKKAIAKVSLYNKMSSETTTNEDNVFIEDVYDSATKKTTYSVCYYTTVGAKIVVNTFDDYDKAVEAAKAAEMTASSATRYLKIDAKKPGKTKLTFNIKNKNGNVSKVSTTIYVVDDARLFSKLTYAGQSLIDDKDLDKKSFYSYMSGTFYTTKAKGKLVAKANANYVIKKIEVGKLYTEAYNYGLSGTYPDGSKYDHSDSYSAYSSTGTTTEHMVDLNGDGDYDDTINGISESNVTYKYSTIKSGRTLKLSKVGENYDSSLSNTTKYEWNTNRKGEKESSSTTSKDRNFYAPTKIRITYYDKLLKQYGTTAYTIKLRVTK